MPSRLQGGTGEIDAYIYGADLFTAPVNTCGVGQQIDVLGAPTATFDAITCPAAPGSTVTVGVVLPIPSEASGLGTINITLVANDTAPSPRIAYCFDVVATV